VAKKNGGDDASFDKFHSFLRQGGNSKNGDRRSNVVDEVLLISGSGEKGKKSLDTIDALERLQKYEDSIIRTDSNSDNSDDAISTIPNIAVAFNPFFPNEYDRTVEQDRLLKKLESGQVSKVYLQFGTDVVLLRQGLEWIAKVNRELLPNINNKKKKDLDICGSIFLPTKKLIAQQKFRPWNGVFLNESFLSGEAGARSIVLAMIQLYHEHNVELLFEAPGIRTEKDCSVMESLLVEADWSNSNSRSKTIAGTDNRKDSANSKSKTKPRSDTERTTNNNRFVVDDDDDDDDDDDTDTDNGETKVDKNTKNARVISKDAPVLTPSRTSPPTNKTRDPFQRKLNNNKNNHNDSNLNAPCILLFGSFDVRLHDNRAVDAASRHSVVIPVFLWSPHEEGKWGVGSALEVPLQDALTSLEERLHRESSSSRGLRLVCRNTDNSAQELFQLCREVGARTVYSNREHTPESAERDRTRLELLSNHGIQLVQCNSSLLYNPEDIELNKGFTSGHFATLMPFLKACKKQLGEPPIPPSLSATAELLSKLKGPHVWPSGVKVKDLTMAVVTGKERWDLPIRKQCVFPMSEVHAHELLQLFLNEEHTGLQEYERQRSRADLEGATSRLSVHLRVGTLSPSELYHQTENSSLAQEEKKTFSRRLIWRELAYFQLHTFPLMRETCIRQHYEHTEWVTGDEEKRRLVAWQTGHTGYPIVDAAMRELWSTGWMTQSVRMVAASFLVEYLRVNWTKGAEWFHYTLVDADSAINSMMWQNAGRSGIDQWNFVMSPETASQDPSGRYTKRWVPELSQLSKKTIHQPWKASESDLETAGVIFGDTYPTRIVEDLKLEREKSLNAVLEMRRNSQNYNDESGYDIIELPSGDKTKVFTKKAFRIDRRGHVIQMKNSSTNSRGVKRDDRKGKRTGGGRGKKIANKKKQKKELLKKAAL